MKRLVAALAALVCVAGLAAAAPGVKPAAFNAYRPAVAYKETVTESLYLPMRDGNPVAMTIIRPAVNGKAVAGKIGTTDHVKVTVFGPVVNLASRLESVSGRSRIIIGQETYAELTRHTPELAKSCVAQEPVTVKGFRQAVQIYEVPWRQV